MWNSGLLLQAEILLGISRMKLMVLSLKVIPSIYLHSPLVQVDRACLICHVCLVILLDHVSQLDPEGLEGLLDPVENNLAKLINTGYF